MSRFVVLLALLGLAACVFSDSGERAAEPSNMQGWRFASGKTPTRVEYAALVAACQDGAIAEAKGRPLAACLADLGLRHVE